MADEQQLAESCLQQDQSGMEEGRRSLDDGPLSAEEADQMLNSTDSTIMAPEPAATRDVNAVQLEPPPITRVLQGRAGTPRARSLADIRVIVLHTPEGSPRATLSVLNDMRASFDFFMPLTGELYKCNDYRRAIAWHAGDRSYNERSVGIEQGDFARNAGQFPDEHYRKLAYLVAWLIQNTSTPLRYAQTYGEDGIIDHRTITPRRRSDPGANFRRDFLMELVPGYLDGSLQSSWAPSGGGGITWVRGQLTAAQGAVARREARRGAGELHRLEAGRSYSTDGYTDAGENVAGSARWYHLTETAGFGWVHSSGGTYVEG